MLLTRLHTNKEVNFADKGEERYSREKDNFIRVNSVDVHNDFSENISIPHQDEHTLVYNSPDGNLPWYTNSRLLCQLDAVFCGWIQRIMLTQEAYEV